jgi:hypothetical protein
MMVSGGPAPSGDGLGPVFALVPTWLRRLNGAGGCGGRLNGAGGQWAGSDRWWAALEWCVRRWVVATQFCFHDSSLERHRRVGGEKGAGYEIFTVIRPPYIHRLTDECIVTYIHQLTDECTGPTFISYTYIHRF